MPIKLLKYRGSAGESVGQFTLKAQGKKNQTLQLTITKPLKRNMPKAAESFKRNILNRFEDGTLHKELAHSFSKLVPRHRQKH